MEINPRKSKRFAAKQNNLSFALKNVSLLRESVDCLRFPDGFDGA